MKKWGVVLSVGILMAILAVPVAMAASQATANVPAGENTGTDNAGTDACRVTALVYWVNGEKQPKTPVSGTLNYSIYVNAGDTVAFRVKCSGPGYVFIRDPALPFHQSMEIPAKGAWVRSAEAYMTLTPGTTKQFWINTGRKGDSYSTMKWGNIWIHT